MPETDEIRIAYSDRQNKRFIELPERIDVYNHIEVKDKVIELLKETDDNLVFDMKNMIFIESSGVSVIVTVHKLLENENRKLYLTNFNNSILEVIRYCKVPYNTI